MNYGPLIFLAAFFALASSWFGFVLIPQAQVGQLQQTNSIGTSATYPLARPGLARQGLEVYRANGCAYCHSQQVEQTGITCEVMLTASGTNEAATVAALRELKPGLSDAEAGRLIAGLPRPVLQDVPKAQADAAVKALNASGAKASVWIVPVGPDIARGWGKRRSVAEDFLFDYPVMLGSQRVGPDLANVGVRRPDLNWHLQHLYAPRIVEGSLMPPYRFLFEQRRAAGKPSPDALVLPPVVAPPVGYEVVPTEQARALAAYLVSLRADVPLFNAPLSAAAPANSTNAPAASGSTSTNTAPAEAPAK